MGNNKSNFRRGSVELLALHLLSEKDCYGSELSQKIKKRSKGIIDIPEGSLYPALYKLIDKGYISDYKQQAGKRLIRVYYHMEASGLERLRILSDDYYVINTGIQDILNYENSQEENDTNNSTKSI